MQKLVLSLIVGPVWLLLPSCDSDSSSMEETKPQPEYSSENVRGYLKGWYQSWERLGVSQQIEKDIEVLLESAHTELSLGDFVHGLTELRFRLDDEFERDLNRGLGWLAIKYREDGLPKWYRDEPDTKMRAEVAQMMGLAFAKKKELEKDEVLNWFNEKSEKIDFMVGYCIEAAKSHPNHAFEDYFGWGFKEGLQALERFPEVIKELPGKTDFAACNERIPKTEQHVAVLCRKAIFKRWAEVRPVEVITLLVHQNKYNEDMYDALLAWGEKDNAKMLNWIGLAEKQGKSSFAWDLAKKIRANEHMPEHPSLAWNEAVQIKKESMREKYIREIHKVWYQKDFEAAEAARKKHDAGTPFEERDGK